MTRHYNIEILETSTHLKATYRDKKFRKLEHLRGVLNAGMVKAIGRLIPPNEANFDEYVRFFKDKVAYTLLEEEKSLYSSFNDEWHRFYEKQFALPPKFTAAEGKSLKGIIAYLTKVSVNETEAYELWKVILEKWDTLSEFHQANADLKYINSKLNILINAIKKQNNTHASSTHGSVSL